MRNWTRRILTTLLAGLPLAIGSAGAQKLPASTTIGTNPAGTVFYAVSAGLAKVISGAGPMQVGGATLYRQQHVHATARQRRNRLRHHQRGRNEPRPIKGRRN